MEERDLSLFDKHVMNLFDISKNILKAHVKRNLSLSNRKNPYLMRLEKYEKTYSKTDPKEHVVYFEKMYSNNKRFILLGPQRDNWLIDGNIIVSFGEECNLKTDINLHVSGIYSTAVKMRDEIQEEMEGLPGLKDSAEIGYPMEFIVCLYKIFREVASSDTEKTKLSGHISERETEVNNSSNNDPLASLFDMASNMAEQVSGNKIPKDKMPGKNDIGKMISSVMENPKTKSMLGNMMQEFQNTNNIGEIVTKLVGGLSGANPTPTESSAIESAPPSQSTDNVNDEFDD